MSVVLNLPHLFIMLLKRSALDVAAKSFQAAVTFAIVLDHDFAERMAKACIEEAFQRAGELPDMVVVAAMFAPAGGPALDAILDNEKVSEWGEFMPKLGIADNRNDWQ